MPTYSPQLIQDLKLDLSNYRTVPQKNEAEAIKAMINISRDNFHALMESIITDGFVPVEYVIVQKSGTDLIVKEGNRRIAILKLIYGAYKIEDFDIPTNLVNQVKLLDSTWLKNNEKVQCAIYKDNETEAVQRIVSLTHGKGEKASRDNWPTVAKARHNREVRGILEPGLDVLEKFLKRNKTITKIQKDKWSGDYKLSILDEVLLKYHSNFGFATRAEVAAKYPKVKFVDALDQIIADIGSDLITFKDVRDDAFATTWGIELETASEPDTNKGTTQSHASSTNTSPKPENTDKSTTNTSSSNNTGNEDNKSSGNNNQSSTGNQNSSSNQNSGSSTSGGSNPLNDPRHVLEMIKKMRIKPGREKIATLRVEIAKLSIRTTPIAFCFLLRSMFEISGKLYAQENGISTKKQPKAKKGSNPGPPIDMTLKEVLAEVYKHLVANNTPEIQKELHGANVEIGKKDGILSITSMNNLVHNPSFSIVPSDICLIFGNIFPLLKHMNS